VSNCPGPSGDEQCFAASFQLTEIVGKIVGVSSDDFKMLDVESDHFKMSQFCDDFAQIIEWSFRR